MPKRLLSDAPRRRLRFSLRSLLVAMLVFTVALGWIAFRANRARINRETLTPHERAVATLSESLCVSGSESRHRAPTWLERVFDDPGPVDDRVHRVDVVGVSFDQAWLSSAGSTRPDSLLPHLKDLDSIRYVVLEGPTVTNSSLQPVGEAITIERLTLRDTAITDDGLEHLTTLTRLRKLLLTGPGITDAGLSHVARLTGLKLLRLWNTKVSKAGVADLQRVLPNCEIEVQ